MSLPFEFLQRGAGFLIQIANDSYAKQFDSQGIAKGYRLLPEWIHLLYR